MDSAAGMIKLTKLRNGKIIQGKNARACKQVFHYGFLGKLVKFILFEV